MSGYEIPDRKYVDGPKKMISWRLPERLISEIEKIAKDKGWTTSELVVMLMDRFVQEENRNKKGTK